MRPSREGFRHGPFPNNQARKIPQHGALNFDGFVSHSCCPTGARPWRRPGL